MTDKDLEKLFEQSEEITPRADLKNEILAKAQQEMEVKAAKKEKNTPRLSPLAKRLVPIAACFVFVFILIGGMLGLVNENYQTVYIDVNPSVALHVNRFDKVSGVEYLNKDAKEALEGIKLKGLSAEEALERMLDAYDDKGYFDGDAEIYISAVSEKNKNADKLIAKLSARAEGIKGNRNYSVNTTKLTAEDRSEADAYGISPGKYRIISEIIEKHPEYTVEDLKDRSMAELKDLLSKNKGNKK
ncbi:MAG: hypothetical protein IJY22_01150 [Clostridia bacterium]|nr:hypothetical protein [Clostridia bacterium]